MKHATFSLPERSADECLHHMPTVARMAPDDWTRGFALSVLRQSRRRGWKVSPKQLSIMRRMVADLFTATGDDGDLIVIDEADHE